jgi:hypothetical protein
MFDTLGWLLEWSGVVLFWVFILNLEFFSGGG